jgi:carbon-monoxide dehydrogenase small subunit
MTAKALLAREPNPSRERIREAIAGNICRCTGYQQIVDAIESAARELRAGGEDAR